MAAASTNVLPKKLDSLTGIRAIAALWVLFFHSKLRDLPEIPTPIRNVIGLGHAAVCFFFVLSGFILAYAYLNRYQSITDRPKLNLQFWQARFARLYPIYLLGFILAAFTQYAIAQKPFYPGNPALEIQSWILRILGLHAWHPPRFFEGPNDPSWSLSVEFLFYALFPLVAVWILKLPEKRLKPWLLVWCLLSFVGPIILLVNGDNGLKVTTELGEFISFNPVFRVPEFVVGVLCGRMFMQNLLPAWIKKYSTMIFWGGIASLFVMVNLGISAALLRYGLTTVLFAVMICAMGYQTGSAARFLSTRPLVLIGEASYALYILHRPIMNFVKDATQRFLGTTPLWAMAAYVPLAIFISILAYKLIESPCNKLIRAWFNIRPATAQP